MSRRESLKKIFYTLAVFGAFLSVAFAFQNCSEAPPPDLEQLGQSSTSATPNPGPPIVVGPTITPTPTPAATATPTPAPTATPTPTPTPTAPPYTCQVYMPHSSGITTVVGGAVPYGYATACTFVCTGPAQFTANAMSPPQCNANPLLVPGTEYGYIGQQRVARPFTNCTVTQPLGNYSTSYSSGQSVCN